MHLWLAYSLLIFWLPGYINWGHRVQEEVAWNDVGRPQFCPAILKFWTVWRLQSKIKMWTAKGGWCLGSFNEDMMILLSWSNLCTLKKENNKLFSSFVSVILDVQHCSTPYLGRFVDMTFDVSMIVLQVLGWSSVVWDSAYTTWWP